MRLFMTALWISVAWGPIGADFNDTALVQSGLVAARSSAHDDVVHDIGGAIGRKIEAAMSAEPIE